MSSEQGSAELRRLLAESERYAQRFDRSSLRARPLTGLAIVTCMDARIVVEEIFALSAGDAHVVRNAGALATDDVIRSLVLSQRVLGTGEVVVLAHTGCGLQRLAEAELSRQLGEETGRDELVSFGRFDDLEHHVRTQVSIINAHPWIRPVPIHGLIYEVESGRVRQVVSRLPEGLVGGA